MSDKPKGKAKPKASKAKVPKFDDKKLKRQILEFTHRQHQMVTKRLRSHLQRINGNSASVTERKILESIDDLLEDGDLIVHSTSGRVPVWRCSDDIIEEFDEQRKVDQKAAEEETIRKAEALAEIEAEKAALQAQMDELEAQKQEELADEGVRIQPV